MLNICSLFQGFFGFIKNINKKAYRTQAMIISGSALVAVISFGAKDFGGSGRNVAKTGTNSFETAEVNTEKDETDDVIDGVGASLLPIERDLVGLENSQQSLVQTDNIVINSSITNAEKQNLLETVEQFTEVGKEIQTEVTEEAQTEQQTEVRTEPQVEVQTEAQTEPQTEPQTEVWTEPQTEFTVESNDYCINLSDDEYYWLTKIVEAEAGDQDDVGKILVVNVIFNRVRSSSFPDSVKEVIFENNGRTYQFEPVKTGVIYDKQPSQNTIDCVNRALSGEDYSQGALFFTMKTSSGSWFNTSLELLFVHGDHYFYTYY